MDVEVKKQQTLMRSLRVFVDALRDIKKPEDASSVDPDIVEAVRVLCTGSDDQSVSSEGLGWHNEVWRRGLVPIFQSLCVCMTSLDELEAHSKNQMGPLRQAERPTAPAGLLSLRDYSVLQAAVELLFCWGAYPRVASGVLLSIEKRRPTKTLEISKDVLMWGERKYNSTDEAVKKEEGDTINDLLHITQALLRLLSLPQLQPILLPKYVVELLALLVYGDVASEASTLMQTEFVRLLEMVLRTLPLRMSMSTLRAVLGQVAPAVSKQEVCQRFKGRCGKLLSRLLMKDGGIVATIEMFLGAVGEGNTQARVQVATLICQCPSGENPERYASALCMQVRDLLIAAVTPERGNTSSKLLGEMAALLADQLATQHLTLFDRHILSALFNRLFIYEDSRKVIPTLSPETSDVSLTECVGIARLLLCGPPPSQCFLQALAPLIRPLFHMYTFAITSRSFLVAPLRELLTAWIRSSSCAALLLQVAVLPVTLPLPHSLLSCGYERTSAAEPWRPLRRFCADGNGGIAFQLVESSSHLMVTDEDLTEPLKLMVTQMVELLSSEELEKSEVVGELFASLLLTYMHVRKRDEPTNRFDQKDVIDEELSSWALYEGVKTPTSAEGVEMVLTLLLALIECLGPSVLRSANAILQCIGTVLATYTTPTMKLVDQEEQDGGLVQSLEEAESEEEGDEILTICLGVVMTILEAGTEHRNESEEQQLSAMLPVLENLSHNPRPEVAELASNARAQILSRDAVDRTNSLINSKREQSFDEALREAEQDLSSKLVPLRARGIVSLTKLVRRTHSHAKDVVWTPRVHALAGVFLIQLHDAESYVFLAAVQGLAVLADTHADVAIPVLVKALGDSSNDLETRIKLSEALLFSAKRCGEALPKFAKLFVYGYLNCIRPPPSKRRQVERIQAEASRRVQLIQEVRGAEEPDLPVEAGEPKHGHESEEELLAIATLRASCLSNLAEVCALLQWGLQPFLLDVLTCVFGVLQMELEIEAEQRPYLPCASIDTKDDGQHNAKKHKEEEYQQRVVAVRRGAVFVLRYLVELLGWKILELMPDQLKPLYHTLKHVVRVDQDRVVVFHASRGLTALDDVMRSELFPRVEQQDAALGISSLRII